MSKKRFCAYVFYTFLVAYFNLGLSWVLLPWLMLVGLPWSQDFLRQQLGFHQLAKEDEGEEEVEGLNAGNDDDSLGETVQWLNTSLQFLWKNSIRQFLNVHLKQTIEKKLSSFGIRVVQFDVGRSAPQIERIINHVSRKSLVTEVVFRVEIRPRVRISWLTSWMVVGLRYFYIRGPMRIQMDRPEGENPRVFSKAQLTFICTPELDYELEGFASIFNHVKPLVKFCTRNVMVYPSAITIKNPMVKNISEISHIKTSEITGILQVSITYVGQALRHPCSCFGLIHPKAILEVDNLRTNADIKGGLSVTHKFPISSQSEEFILRSSKVGLTRRCNIENKLDQTLVLRLDKLKEFNGCVNLHGKKFDIKTWIEPARFSSSSKAILSIIIVEMNSFMHIEPLVTLQMSGQDDFQHTSVGLKSRNWHFLQEFAFFVDHIATDRLTIGLADYNDCKSMIKPEEGKANEFEEDFYLCNKIKPMAKFHMRIADLLVNQDQAQNVTLEPALGIKGHFDVSVVTNLRVCTKEK